MNEFDEDITVESVKEVHKRIDAPDRLGDGPVGKGSTLSKSHDVLDIKIGLSTVVRVIVALRGRVGAFDGLYLLLGEVVLRLELLQSEIDSRRRKRYLEIRRAETLAKRLENSHVSLGSSISLVGKSVQVPDGGGDNAGARLALHGDVIEGSLLVVHGEIIQTDDTLNQTSENGGHSVVLGTLQEGVAFLGVENVELGVEHLLDGLKRTGNFDVLTVGGFKAGRFGNTEVGEEVVDGIKSLDIVSKVTDLIEGIVLTILGGSWRSGGNVAMGRGEEGGGG